MLINTKQGPKEKTAENVTIFSIIKGLMVAYLISIPAFLLFALILTNTDFPEKYKSIAVIITTIVSLFVAGMTATKGSRSKGWLNGSVAGFIYMLVLYLLSSIIYRNFSIDRYVITMAVIGILTGAVGGIAGINVKAGSTRQRHARS